MRATFGLLVAAVAVYELVALVNRESGDTISERAWATKRPLVPFVAGMVAGHLFWHKGE